MRWEALFADVEAQLEAAAAASLLGEVGERTRAERSAVALGARIAAGRGRELRLTVRGGHRVGGVVVDAGAGWVLLREPPRDHLVPLDAVVLAVGVGDQVGGSDGAAVRRLGLGHALRAVARDRAVVRVVTDAGVVVGRVDGVGADHLDIGLADEADRRPTGARVAVPFSALAALGDL